MNWHSPELVSKLEARCGVEDLMCSNSKVRCTRSEGEQLLLYWGNGQYIYLTLQWNHSHELALTWTGDETRSKMRCGRSDVFEQQGAVYEIWRRTVVVVLRQWAVYLLNIAMKSFSWTGTHLNWRWNSKQDAVWKIWGVRTASCGAKVLMCLIARTIVFYWGNAQCILVRWKRGSSQRRALWSAENEAVPQSKALWSAESEAKNHGKISNFRTFLLYLDYELLLRSLRSLRSNYTRSQTVPMLLKDLISRKISL